jgi:ABC-type branched-subunit amino acid transport system permease subunit
MIPDDPMADLNQLFADNLALAFGVLAAIVLALLVAVLVLSARVGRATRAYRDLVRDSDSG